MQWNAKTKKEYMKDIFFFNYRLLEIWLDNHLDEGCDKIIHLSVITVCRWHNEVLTFLWIYGRTGKDTISLNDYTKVDAVELHSATELILY